MRWKLKTKKNNNRLRLEVSKSKNKRYERTAKKKEFSKWWGGGGRAIVISALDLRDGPGNEGWYGLERKSFACGLWPISECRISLTFLHCPLIVRRGKPLFWFCLRDTAPRPPLFEKGEIKMGPFFLLGISRSFFSRDTVVVIDSRVLIEVWSFILSRQLIGKYYSKPSLIRHISCHPKQYFDICITFEFAFSLPEVLLVCQKK